MKTTQKEEMTLTEKKEGIVQQLKTEFNDVVFQSAYNGKSALPELESFLSQQLDIYAEAVREEAVGDILDVIWGEEKNGFVKANSLIEYIEENYLQSQKKGQTEEEV